MIKELCIYFYIISDLKITSSYLYPYESESREIRSLDGLWDFKVSSKSNVNIGFHEAWFKKEFSVIGDSIKMPVPSSFNDVTTNATIRDYLGWAWYQRSFYVPKSWLEGDIRVFLHFGSVHYFASLFLNGVRIGTHEGGHVAFQIEIPLKILSTYNLLTVAVNNTLTPNTIPQGYLNFPNDTKRYPKGYRQYVHAFDYFDYAGINRPVTLFTTPKMYISDVVVKTGISHQIGHVGYRVSTYPESTNIKVELYDALGNVVAQSGHWQGKLLVHNPHLWWPAMTCGETPGYLYKLRVTLSEIGLDNDVYTMPVGIRTVTWTNTSVLINNRSVYLRGFGMHEDADIRGRGFDFVVMTRDMNLISWVGANTFRTSHYPYAQETLNAADALGIMVIVEAPACSLNGFGEKLYERHKMYVKEMMSVYKNHPSVIMWSLANEPVTNSLAADYYFGNLSDVAKKYDLTRPVTFVSSQQPLNETAAKHMDVVCVNRYPAWYSDYGHTDLIKYQVINEISEWYRKYSRPVIVTEYGAGSIPGLHTLPETMWSEEYQAVTHLEHFKAFDVLRQMGSLAGELMWNFIDFNTPQEYIRPGRCSKGLFTRERQPKLAAHIVRRRYLSLQNCSDKLEISDNLVCSHP